MQLELDPLGRSELMSYIPSSFETRGVVREAPTSRRGALRSALSVGDSLLHFIKVPERQGYVNQKFTKP